MAKADLEKALQGVEPVTKAAQVREVMPIIERQLKSGVRQQAILDVLKAQGIELTPATFKSYLARYRKTNKTEGKAPSAPRETVAQQAPTIPSEPESVSYDKEPDTDLTPPSPVGPGELGRVMNPGDDANASDMARYETAGKKQRRKT